MLASLELDKPVSWSVIVSIFTFDPVCLLSCLHVCFSFYLQLLELASILKEKLLIFFHFRGLSWSHGAHSRSFDEG